MISASHNNVSRWQVASYLAPMLAKNRTEAVRLATAWLIETGREDECNYLAHDIAAIWETKGYVWARITTARALPSQAREQVTNYIQQTCGASYVELDESVQPGMLGGIKIETSQQLLDASLSHKLGNLTSAIAS